MSLTIVSWNIEGGCREDHLQYLKNISDLPEVSIICLQEVHCAYDPSVPREVWPKDPGNRGHNPIRTHLYQEIKEMLDLDWSGWFAPQLVGFLHDTETTSYQVGFGQATFIRESAYLQLIGHASGFAYGQLNYANLEAKGGLPSSKSMSAVRLRFDSQYELIVGNVHGFWSKLGKVDMPERYKQNEGINKMLLHPPSFSFPYFRAQNVLLVGDLNYHSGMQALEDLRLQPVFGLGGGEVLNHRFGITSTRTSYYPEYKPYREADFALASRKLTNNVTNCWVDNEVPSDHGALFVQVDF